MSNAATHSADCYLWHHDCAVAQVEELQQERDALRAAAEQALEALEDCSREHKITYVNEVADLRAALEEKK